MRSTAPNRSARRFEIDWVIVSVEGMRRWGLKVLLLIVAAGIVGTSLYLLHEPIQRRAERALRRASAAQEALRSSGVPDSLTNEFDVASRVLEEARQHYAVRDYPACLARAEDALRRFELLTGLSNHDFVGSGQIISVEGQVETQRANQTKWEKAHEKQPLYNGDFVKTGRDGTAEILFTDGTVLKVGPDSLLEVHREAPTTRDAGGEVRVRVGQVNVYTATQPSTVVTDAARADVDRDSRVGVEVADDSSTTIAAYAGRAHVTGSSGSTVDLSDRQAVRAAPGGALGDRRRIPQAPGLETPPANFLVNIDDNDRVELRWRKVVGARSYLLEVSRSRLFQVGSLELEAGPRRDNSATLRIILPGTYYWRVAAEGESGVRSEWSSPRAFRAFRGARMEELADTTPPRLDVQPPRQMGNMFLIQGTTEPGASVTINDEGVEVSAEGTFSKTVAVHEQGRNVIVIRATDPAGNVTEHRETVFVEGD